jgi:ABC-type transporter Mla MlaB component
MQEHDAAYGVIEGHPIFGSVESFLRRKGVSREMVDFLSPRLCFAYPKAFWLKLAAGGAEDLRGRQAINSEQIGTILRAWLERQSVFRRIVFDLRGLTILDLDDLLAFFNSLRGDFRYFYVCDSLLAPLLLHKGVPESLIVCSEAAMLHRLRHDIPLEECAVQLQRTLTVETLDSALLQHAGKRQLSACDVVAFDLSAVTNVDFPGLSMLAPVIHSIGNVYGTLALISNARRKTHRAFDEIRFWDVMAAHLLNSNPRPPPLDSANIFFLRTFTDENLNEVQDKCAESFDRLLGLHTAWFTRMAGLTKRSWQSAVDRTAALILDLRLVIRELVDNVTFHSHGLGYITMSFDAKVGLWIYVGDTGIGLARGMRRKYKFSVTNDAKAIELALRLQEYKHKRRRTRGAFSYGGHGLDRISLILHDLYGELRIRSRGFMGRFLPAESRKPVALTSDMFPLQGTHLHIFIPSRKP